MNNGSDHNGDDEASADGSYTQNDNDQGHNSDRDQSQSEETFSNDNENDITEGNDEVDEGDCLGETPRSNESFADLFKLLPYLYLIQKNYGVNSSLIPGFELTNSQLCANQAEFSDSRSFRSLLESDHFKNLQQLLPYGNSSCNGMNFNGGNAESDEDIHCEDSSEHDEPLDLTQKTKIMPRTIREEKTIRPVQRAERGYTIQALEAALEDIQSGKLGTRRAAVIYGIPRSTLRNKVYKLGKTQLKSTASYNNGVGLIHDKSGESDCGPVFINTLNKSLNGEDFEMHDDCNEDTFNVSDNHGISRNPYSLLRNDTLGGNQGRINDGHHNDGGERNQLLFMGGGGKGHNNNQRRHGSRPSLSLPNYPRAQCSGTSYDNFSDSSLGKKSRPKRGKYRNYDREALAKAVQAVQNGEMSVHRAGSYFGVPHSTLEYKVKERHLLRQAKFKGKSTAANKPISLNNKMTEQTASFSATTPVLSPSAMLDSNDSSNFQKTLPDMAKSLSEFMRHGLLSVGESRWRSPLLGLGFTNADTADADTRQDLRKEINAPLPKIYDPNESLENNPSDLLDLTRKT